MTPRLVLAARFAATFLVVGFWWLINRGADPDWLTVLTAGQIGVISTYLIPLHEKQDRKKEKEG